MTVLFIPYLFSLVDTNHELNMFEFRKKVNCIRVLFHALIHSIVGV